MPISDLKDVFSRIDFNKCDLLKTIEIKFRDFCTRISVFNSKDLHE